MSYHVKERAVEPISSVSVVSTGTSPMLFVADSTPHSEVLNSRRTPGVGLRCRLLEPSRTVKVLNRRHHDLVVLSAHARLAEVRLARAVEDSAVE
jgi:hypothetical protein